MKGILSKNTLEEMGIRSDNVEISEKVGIYTSHLKIGDNVRIDDHVILTGDITIGSYVHIASGCYLYGSGGLEIGNYSNIATRTTILTATDDFSGESMIGPTVPEEFRRIKRTRIIIGDHVIIGAGSLLLPGAEIREGVAVGAMSLVNRTVGPWVIVAGIPAKYLKPRLQNCRDMSLYMERIT